MPFDADEGEGRPTRAPALHFGPFVGGGGHGATTPCRLGLLVAHAARIRVLGRPPGRSFILLAALGATGTAACTAPEQIEVATPAAPTSTLLCRAGPAISVASRYDLSFAYTWVAAGGSQGYEIFGNMAFNVEAGRAPGPAGADGGALAPGTCGFADRPLASHEPSRLSYGGRLQPGLTMTWTTHVGQTGAPQFSGPVDELGRDSGKVLKATVTRDADAWRIRDFEIL